MCAKDTASVAFGYCHCGCGQKTPIAKQTHTKSGWIKGQPIRFCKGHASTRPACSFEILPDGELAIHIPSGYTAIVDAEDAERVKAERWHAAKRTHVIYAQSSSGVLLHRFILQPARDLFVDHIDGDGLNNRRSNLRICTKSQNAMNVREWSHNTSGYKGVVWHAQRGKWRAEIGANGESRHLGLFESAEEAARAYDDAARELHGEFAVLNFPRALMDRAIRNEQTGDADRTDALPAGVTALPRRAS